ncbi:MAG: tetratricopeptide repeat protein [Bacteroidales bacterium]
MDGNIDKFFNEEEIFKSLSKYNEMREGNKSYFFDLFEFEEIIEYYIDNEDYTEAYNATCLALKSYSFASSLKLKLAKLLTEQDRKAKALQIIHEIETVEMYNYELFLLKGKLLSLLGNHHDAVKEYDRAIKLARENRDEVVYSIAQNFLTVGKESVAIKYLILAYEINADNPLVLYDLASCFERLEYYDKCIEFLLKYIDIDPFSENVWFNLAVAYSEIEKNNKALEAVEFALAINPGYLSASFLKAEILFDLGKYSEAIGVYHELLNLDPHNVRVLCCLGECFEKTGKRDKALDYFRQARKSDNTSPEPWFGMAVVYRNNGKLNHSLINVRKAIKLDDENPEYWFFLGELFELQDNPEHAMKAFSRAIEIDPSDYEAWLAYAKIYYEENKISDAIEILNKAYQYNYDNSTLNYQLAAYHTSLHEYSLAASYFEKGLSLNFPEHQDYINKIQGYFDKETIQNILSKYQNQK